MSVTAAESSVTLTRVSVFEDNPSVPLSYFEKQREGEEEEEKLTYTVTTSQEGETDGLFVDG